MVTAAVVVVVVVGWGLVSSGCGLLLVLFVVGAGGVLFVF
jgi:hypothetical protein